MAYTNREDLYAAQKRHRLKIRKMVFEFLSTHPCIDCGETDPVVLEFDHTDPKTKTKQISRMLSGHYGWETIVKEIKKCEIRCANCHRRKSYVQFGHFGRTKPL